jgi:hypothetical protein
MQACTVGERQHPNGISESYRLKPEDQKLGGVSSVLNKHRGDPLLSIRNKFGF